ncbi:hypothetical protein ACHAWC_004662 [Mediolabrus comicus]
MCAYNKYTGSCNGDSGGPLFLENEHGDIGDQPTQVGIVSWGMPPCVTSGHPKVFARVSYYSEWIKETVCSRPEHASGLRRRYVPVQSMQPKSSAVRQNQARELETLVTTISWLDRYMLYV